LRVRYIGAVPISAAVVAARVAEVQTTLLAPEAAADTVTALDVLLPPSGACLDAVLGALSAAEAADLAGRVVLAPDADAVEDAHALPPPTTAGLLARAWAEATGMWVRTTGAGSGDDGMLGPGDTGGDGDAPPVAPPLQPSLALLAPPALDLWQGLGGGTRTSSDRPRRHRVYLPRPDHVDVMRYEALGRLLAHGLVQPHAAPPCFPPFVYRWLVAPVPTTPAPTLADLDIVDVAAAQRLRLRLALSDPADKERHAETVCVSIFACA
jgi:hypothetical protein